MLDGMPASRIFVSDFTVHSLGVVMSRFGQIQAYEPLLTGLGIGREILVVEVDVGELARVVSASTTHKLDFDDAYQYAAAEIHGLTLVSLDNDFDRTPRRRLTPAEALKVFQDEQQKP